MRLTSVEHAKLYFEQDMAEGEVFEIASGTVGVFSMRCPDKETPNEDAAALIPYDEKAAVLVVADGLGGVPAGEQAARIAVKGVEAAVCKAHREGIPLRVAIIDAIEDANRKIQEMAVGSGTTLALVEIQDGEVRPYHIGDSMILAVGQRGKVKLQTISHSPVGYALEAGVLDEAEAMEHEDRHLVSNVIGTAEMRIELGPVLRLATYDTLLIATDGLFDNMELGEIIERLRKGPMVDVLRQLATMAKDRMVNTQAGKPSKPDDLTFVAFRRL